MTLLSDYLAKLNWFDCVAALRIMLTCWPRVCKSVLLAIQSGNVTTHNVSANYIAWPTVVTKWNDIAWLNNAHQPDVNHFLLAV